MTEVQQCRDCQWWEPMGDDAVGSCTRITLPKDLQNPAPAEIVALIRRKTEKIHMTHENDVAGDFWLATRADFGCVLWEATP